MSKESDKLSIEDKNIVCYNSNVYVGYIKTRFTDNQIKKLITKKE